MQDIRILPIGCILIVVRVPSQGEGGVVQGSGVVINDQYAQVGLYVGPSISTPVAARVAVKSGGKLKILVTSNFRSGSDIGRLNIYPHVERGLKTLLEEQKAIGVVSELEEEPDTEEPFHYDKPGVEERSSDMEPGTSTEQAEQIGPKGSNESARHQRISKKQRGRPRGSRGRRSGENGEPSAVPTGPPTPVPTGECRASASTSGASASMFGASRASTGPSARSKSRSRNAKTHCCVSVQDIPSNEPSESEPKRSARIRDRMQRPAELGGVARDTADLETACFAD